MVLPPSARELIESDALAHLVTLNRDGSPQVSCVWVGLEGDEIVSGHLPFHQKLRNVQRDPRVVIVSQPTRGLDVGASEYVRAELLARRRDGAAILLISEDLDELLSLSDRVIVLYEGRLVGHLRSSEADPEQLGLLMAGRGQAAA